MFFYFSRNFKFFQNDSLGCNSVSWSPYNPSSSHSEDGSSMVRRLVTGSCDNLIRIWRSTVDNEGNIISNWSEELKSCPTPHTG